MNAPQLQTIVPVRLHVTGLTELVMANGQLADPDHPIVRQISELTARGSDMTTEERARKDLLQWRGHLYVDPAGRVAMPVRNLLRCLSEAGSALGKGTASLRPAVERGIQAGGTAWIPLDYPGPADIEELAADPAYRWRAIVNLNPTSGRKGGKGPKTWPIFRAWSFEAELTWVPLALDWDKAERVVETAGHAIGIGDARRLGHGRFQAKLVRVDP